MYARHRDGRAGRRRSTQAQRRIIALATICVASLASACTGIGGDWTSPDSTPRCYQETPRLQGSWTGTLGAHELTLRLTESCESYPWSSGAWIARGDWEWGGITGTAESNPYYREPWDIALRVGPVRDGRMDVVLSFMQQLPAGPSLIGHAAGRWRNDSDTTQVYASFDTVARRSCGGDTGHHDAGFRRQHRQTSTDRTFGREHQLA